MNIDSNKTNAEFENLSFQSRSNNYESQNKINPTIAKVFQEKKENSFIIHCLKQILRHIKFIFCKDTKNLSFKKNSNAFKENFSICYNSLVNDFKNLKLDTNSINQKLDKLSEIDCHFEDYSSFIDSDVKKLLTELDSKLSSDHYTDDQRKFFLELVNDMVLFTYLKPARILEINNKNIYYESINVLSIKDLKRSLWQILNQKVIDLSKSDMLCHINVEEYTSMSLKERMATLSISKLNIDFRSDLENSPIFRKILKNSNLEEFLFAGSDEQLYINTCSAATYNQELKTNLSNIEGLILIAEKLANFIEFDLSQLNDNIKKQEAFTYFFTSYTKEEYAQKRLGQVRKDLNEIKNKLNTLSQLEDANPRKIRGALKKLERDLSRQMQRLSSVIDPEFPIYLTYKPIKNQWLLSAILMAIPSLLSSFLPNKPFFTKRIDGINREDLYDKFPLLINNEKNYINFNITKALSKLKQQDPERKEIIKEVWLKVMETGGKIAGRGSMHSIFIKAIIDEKGEQAFLIGDPKEDTYRKLNFEEAMQYFLSSKTKLE